MSKCIIIKPLGIEQQKQTSWTRFNRVEANHGMYAELLHKCGKLESPICDDGSVRQTLSHLVQERPPVQRQNVFTPLS